MLRLMGVSAPSLHRVYRLSDIGLQYNISDSYLHTRVPYNISDFYLHIGVPHTISDSYLHIGVLYNISDSDIIYQTPTYISESYIIYRSLLHTKMGETNMNWLFDSFGLPYMMTSILVKVQ